MTQLIRYARSTISKRDAMGQTGPSKKPMDNNDVYVCNSGKSGATAATED